MSITQVRTEERWLDTVPLQLPTNVLSGSFLVPVSRAGLSDIAILNPTGAAVSYAIGQLSSMPGDAITAQPYTNLGLPINSTQMLTVFWSASTLLSTSNHIVTLLLSNYTITISGGANTSGGVASNVQIVGTPNVNVNSMPALNVTTLPSVTSVDGGLVTLGAEADVANVAPATSGTLMSFMKGLVKQAQGGGAGAMPVSAANLDATISSLVTAVNACTTAVTAMNTQLAKQTPTTGYMYNVTCTAANTEYSQVLPANTKRFAIMNKGNAPGTTWKWYLTSAAANTMDYAGNVGYTEEMVYLAAQTLYFKSSNAGDVIQILAWV